MADAAKRSSAMSVAEIDTMRSVEDDLWWYRGLRRHVVDSIDPPHPAFKLLDAGCGTGGMLSYVRARFPEAALTGLDFGERALELTRQRNLGAELVQGSTDQLPFADAAFAVVLSLDVIVLHGIDDQQALRDMHRVLRPGGQLIMNVAAFDFLRGSHDAATNMARRYTRPRLARLFENAGFQSHRMSYWNMSLMPAVAAVRWASRRRAQKPGVRSDLKPMWQPLNAALAAITRAELRASRAVPLPFGTSLFAVAWK
ncbi:MAG TPA: class I SAM-dependent methyltransferase [Chthoniobacterales bacterium]|nr:class I SAM-dependent methyltransferase [Chthoniobacterales bacterium]